MILTEGNTDARAGACDLIIEAIQPLAILSPKKSIATLSVLLKYFLTSPPYQDINLYVFHCLSIWLIP